MLSLKKRKKCIIDEIFDYFDDIRSESLNNFEIPRFVEEPVCHWKEGVAEYENLINNFSQNIRRTLEMNHNVFKMNMQRCGEYLVQGLNQIDVQMTKLVTQIPELLRIENKAISMEKTILVKKPKKLDFKITFEDLAEGTYRISTGAPNNSNPKGSARSNSEKEDDLLNFSDLGITLLEVTNFDIGGPEPTEHDTTYQTEKMLIGIDEESSMENLLFEDDDDNDLLKSREFEKVNQLRNTIKNQTKNRGKAPDTAFLKGSGGARDFKV